MVWNICYFPPLLGEFSSNLTFAYVSNGLVQPPTRKTPKQFPRGGNSGGRCHPKQQPRCRREWPRRYCFSVDNSEALRGRCKGSHEFQKIGWDLVGNHQLRNLLLFFQILHLKFCHLYKWMLFLMVDLYLYSICLFADFLDKFELCMFIFSFSGFGDGCGWLTSKNKRLKRTDMQETLQGQCVTLPKTNMISWKKHPPWIKMYFLLKMGYVPTIAMVVNSGGMSGRYLVNGWNNPFISRFIKSPK